jgi:hypothetical protein
VILDFLFKPLEFICALIRRDKDYFGIKSPSQELSRGLIEFHYGVIEALQEIQCNRAKSAFTPYEIKRTDFASEYKPLMDVVYAFKRVQYNYRSEFELYETEEES